MEPQINADERGLDGITEKIIGCAYAVANELGCGFLEKVYENAMFVALTQSELQVRQQWPMVVRFRQVVVGDYIADLFVEEQVLVEVKAVKALDEVHSA
jgi:GxxExxY protein